MLTTANNILSRGITFVNISKNETETATGPHRAAPHCIAAVVRTTSHGTSVGVRTAVDHPLMSEMGSES
jgi:hypothetical protein